MPWSLSLKAVVPQMECQQMKAMHVALGMTFSHQRRTGKGWEEGSVETSRQNTVPVPTGQWTQTWPSLHVIADDVLKGALISEQERNVPSPQLQHKR